MELKAASGIIICDDPETMESIKIALGPVVKNLIATKTSDEAYQRASRGAFDFYVVRTKKPHIGAQNSLFHWCRKEKGHAHSQWFVLGTDIETPEMTKPYPQVNVMPDATDYVGLLHKMREKFPATAAPAAPVNSVGAAELKPMLASAVTALRAVLGQELKGGEIRTQLGAPVKSDVMGSLTLGTAKLTGSVAIHLPRSAMSRIQESVHATKPEEVLGRFTGLVSEAARKEFAVAGHKDLSASPDPEGAGYRENLKSQQVYLCVPFETSYGPVTVECLVRAK